MWKVEAESLRVELEIRRMIQFKEIDDDSLKLINSWMECLEIEGPTDLLVYAEKWNDHELYGSWTGYRSASFSYSGRIIYRIDDELKVIKIARITMTHDYRRSED